MNTLTEQDYENVTKESNCEVDAIKAVAEVESKGDGFLSTDDPKILFERNTGQNLHNFTMENIMLKINMILSSKMLTKDLRQHQSSFNYYYLKSIISHLILLKHHLYLLINDLSTVLSSSPKARRRYFKTSSAVFLKILFINFQFLKYQNKHYLNFSLKYLTSTF